MVEPQWALRIATAVVLATSSGCGNPVDEPRGQPDRGADRAADRGPLVAHTGEGATISLPLKSGKRSQTLTFGTVLCSSDPDAEIVLDAVRYDMKPELPADWSPEAMATDRPSIGTWLRAVPPPDNDEDEYDNTSIIGIRGGRQRLSGEVVPFADGLPAPITHDCEDYLDRDRTFPIIELLTVMTMDERGSVARRTHVDYHVGDDDYSLTIRWEVGACGSEVEDPDCPKR